MEPLNIRIGPLAFDHADYDADGDVLYLHVGEPRPGEGEETPEGHVLRFVPGTHKIIGLTVINARHVLNRDGRLIVTVPETVEASAEDLAAALHAACTSGPEPCSPRAGEKSAARSRHSRQSQSRARGRPCR